MKTFNLFGISLIGLVMGGMVLSVVSFSIEYSPLPPGGAGTITDETENAFQHPMAGIDRELRGQFFVGNSFFRDSWVVAPASTKARDGLGPTFNANSCSSCHQLDGRGAGFTKSGRVDLSLLFRLAIWDGEKMVPHPAYGDQFNPFAVSGVESEGKVEVEFTLIKGKYPDGTEYELRLPKFRFTDLAFGDLSKTRVSPRVAPQMVGLGLLEAISAEDILALEDPKDLNEDGISGRAQKILNPETLALELGRFGWKGGKPSLRSQNAAAFLGDIGITSTLFPKENCPEPQANCKAQPNGGDPELSEQILNRVTTYTQLLAVPNRRIKNVSMVARGDQLFSTIGCVKCHHAEFTTSSSHPLEILRGQKITPYTDLLLHDMGMDLADHKHEGVANGKEWKTPPLWGIGLISTVNGHTNLLHDGRARNVEEAILWHGGEAEGSKIRFMNLSLEERTAILEFVNSL